MPLFVADATTAFALLINCLSPMRAVYQFGLCGGVLVMLNFGIVLVYTPALLVLHEARVIYDPSATVGSHRLMR